MTTESKPSKTETKGPGGRRSTRLSIAIPITISGKDASGASFRENVHTLVVNAHGAMIVTCHQLAVGAEVLIENRALVRSTRANVAFVGKEPGPSGLLEVGVQLPEAQNIWGIQFPPDDWQDYKLAGEGGSETTRSAPPAGTKPGATPGAANAQARPGEPLSSATARPTVPAVARGAEAGPPEQSAAATDGALRRVNQLAGEAADQHAALFGERLTKVMSQTDLEAQTGLQQEARQLHEKTIRSMVQETNALITRLQETTYDITQGLLTKSYEIEKGSHAQVEKVQEKLKEAGRQTLEDTLEELKGKAKHQFETLSADSLKQLHQRLERGMAGDIEAFLKAVDIRLTALTVEHLTKLVSELEARQAQLHDAMQTATGQFRQELKKLTEEMAASLRGDGEILGEGSVGRRTNPEVDGKDAAGG